MSKDLLAIMTLPDLDGHSKQSDLISFIGIKRILSL